MGLILGHGQHVNSLQCPRVVRKQFDPIERRAVIESPGELVVAEELHADRLIVGAKIAAVDRR